MFSNGRGPPIATGDPVVRRAFMGLAAAYPATVGLDELAAGATRARIGDALLPLVLSGQASVSALPLQVGRAFDERPKVWAFARMEAASGQPWITSLGHVGVPVHPVLRALLPYLDGSHDRAALRALFIEAVAGGAPGITEPPAERLDAVAGHHVEQTLHYCERHALLEP